MRLRAILGWALCGTLLGAPRVVAQTDQPVKPETARFGNPTSIARHLQDYIYGVVKTIDNKELVLDKTKFGVDQTFKLDAKTKFIRDGKPSTLTELKLGDTVYVNAKTDKKTRTMTARKVVSGMLPTP